VFCDHDTLALRDNRTGAGLFCRKRNLVGPLFSWERTAGLVVSIPSRYPDSRAVDVLRSRYLVSPPHCRRGGLKLPRSVLFCLDNSEIGRASLRSGWEARLFSLMGKKAAVSNEPTAAESTEKWQKYSRSPLGKRQWETLPALAR
jgi:hypothetical protein